MCFVNIDKRRKIECLEAECYLDKTRCQVKYGKTCIRNGGTKIPIQSNTVSESFPLTVQAQTTFKPYFIVDGKAIMDELEGDL